MSIRNPRMTSAPSWRFARSKRMFAWVLIAGILGSGDAAAQWIVNDPIQTAKHVAEFKEQMERWKQTVDHYRQQLISLGGMSVAPTALNNPNADFPPIDPDYGLKDACRAQRGDLMGTIRNVFRPDPNKDILEQQLDICQRIVRAENMKYNETVKYLNNLRARQRELDRLDETRRSVGTEQGKLSSVFYDALRQQQSSKMDIDQWQAMMLAYDSYITQLNKYQQRLAQRALRGQQPDIISAVIQGELLKKTLDRKRNED